MELLLGVPRKEGGVQVEGEQEQLLFFHVESQKCLLLSVDRMRCDDLLKFPMKRRDTSFLEIRNPNERAYNIYSKYLTLTHSQ